MVEKLFQDLTTNQEFKTILTQYSSKIIHEHILSRFNPENETRKLTKCEKAILVKTILGNEIPPLEEFKKLNADINTFVIPIEEQIYTLFTMLEKRSNDDEMCEIIELLSKNGYNLNERTIYNGGNTLLTCVLAIKPKSSLKLLKLGVNPNVTNQTLDTVYQASKNFIAYIDTEVYKQILETRNLLDKKADLINEYNQIIEYIEQNNIPKEVNDDFYQEIDDYIKQIATQNSLNEEETQALKEAIYQLAIRFTNGLCSNFCENNNL